MTTLPRFGRVQPKVARLKVNGFGEEGDDAMQIGEVVHLLIEARIEAVEHREETKVGVVRLHKADILRHVRYPDVDAAVGLLDAEDERRRAAEDEAKRAEEQETGVLRLDDALEGGE